MLHLGIGVARVSSSSCRCLFRSPVITKLYPVRLFLPQISFHGDLLSATHSPATCPLPQSTPQWNCLLHGQCTWLLERSYAYRLSIPPHRRFLLSVALLSLIFLYLLLGSLRMNTLIYQYFYKTSHIEDSKKWSNPRSTFFSGGYCKAAAKRSKDLVVLL